MKPYYQHAGITIYHGDCREVLPQLTVVDAVIADLPYGTTNLAWDEVLPLPWLWQQFYRLCADDAPVVLFGSEPFSTVLRSSNLAQFRHEWIWVKDKAGNFASCEHSPLKIHEHINVFSKAGARYFPQMQSRLSWNRRRNSPRINTSAQTGTRFACLQSKGDREITYPRSVLFFDACREYLHPTQKPIELLSYLVQTYSREQDLILDPCIGSGTTIHAAKRLNRCAIGIEIEEKYCEIAAKRLSQEVLNFAESI